MMSEDKLVLKLFQSQYTGTAAWEVDESKSTVRLPQYDGSDNQRITLRVLREIKVTGRTYRMARIEATREIREELNRDGIEGGIKFISLRYTKRRDKEGLKIWDGYYMVTETEDEGTAPKPWKADEVRYLKNNYRRLTLEALAENLGRSESSVSSKIYNLGLR